MDVFSLDKISYASLPSISEKKNGGWIFVTRQQLELHITVENFL